MRRRDEQGEVETSIAVCPAVLNVPSHSMDPFEHHSFALLRKILWFLGLWYTQPYNQRLLRYFIIGFVLIFAVFMQLCQVSTMGRDMQSFVAASQIFLPSLYFTVIYYVNILDFVIVQKIFNCIKHDWQQLYNDVDFKSMEKCASESKLFTQILAFLFTFFATSIILPSIIHKIFFPNEKMSGTERFPIESCVDHFLDREIYYYHISAVQIIFVIIHVLVAIGCYSIYVLIVQHVNALLSVTKERISREFKYNQHNNNVVEIPIDISHWLIDIIRSLAKIKKITYLLNKMFQTMLLLQTVLSFFIITIDLIWFLQIPNMLKNDESLKDVPALIISIVGTIFPIYFNAYIGQQLIDNSVIVYREACLIPIHEVSLKSQKLLLTTLTMNAKPCAVSIGKMFVSSNEFLSDLFRTSLSFAMVLHSKI